jgi:hypothetical protein
MCRLVRIAAMIVMPFSIISSIRGEIGHRPPFSTDCKVRYRTLVCAIFLRLAKISGPRCVPRGEPYLGSVFANVSHRCSRIMGPQQGKLSGRRMLIWLENFTFAAWACAACNWITQNPGVAASAGPPPKVLQAFMQHDCRKIPAPERGLEMMP